MTDREKAIVMAYTGYCMLAGDKLKVFYEYVGELLGRPVYTHEFADPDIREKASDDFYKLCRETTPEDMDDLQKDADYWHKLAQSYEHTICTMSQAIAEYSEKRWIPCSERLPERTSEKQKRGWYLTTNGYGSVGVTKYEFEANSFGYIGWGEGHRQADIKIIAWMPLPKPWKEEKEEGEPIPHWRGQMDGCLPFSDGGE